MSKNKNSKITIHMVSSLDGFISSKDNDITWLESKDYYEKGYVLSEEDMNEFVKKIDCYVMGSSTYEQALKLGWPYGDTPVIVLTSRSLIKERSSVKFYSGDLSELVNSKLKLDYKNIWMVGGAMMTKAFIRLGLTDEIIISILPIILGDGLPFFDHIGNEQLLHLKDTKAYRDGMVELHYEIRKD